MSPSDGICLQALFHPRYYEIDTERSFILYFIPDV
jgi:hypothetical protein